MMLLPAVTAVFLFAVSSYQDCSTHRIRDLVNAVLPLATTNSDGCPILKQMNDLAKTMTDPTRCGKQGVFHLRKGTEGYALSFEEAVDLCAAFGARVATLAQLQTAWRNGYDSCAFGWLADKTKRYPCLTAPGTPRRGCCSSSAIISDSSYVDQNYGGKADVYCFKE